jgi:thioesterase domain-containing protein
MLCVHGFEGEPCFESIQEALAVYYIAIKGVQATAPYDIAGYSYGTTLACELAKMVESEGSEVRFLGLFKLPPYIRTRMK